MRKYGYLTFPITLLNFHANNTEKTREKIDKIMDWSIVYLMQQNKPGSDYDIARQVCYDFYRRPSTLFVDLKKSLQDMVEEYNLPEEPDMLFEGNEFKADEEIETILLEIRESINFWRISEMHYLKHITEDIMNITINDWRFYRLYNEDYPSQKYPKNCPMISIKTDWVFDARDGKIPLSLFRIICAVRSIVGKKKYAITNRYMILARMFGLRSPKMLSSLTGKIKEACDHQIKRYPFDKLMENAVKRGFFTKISASRGYYISTSLSIEKLEEAVIRSIEKKDSRRKLYKDSAKRIMEKSKRVHQQQRGSDTTS